MVKTLLTIILVLFIQGVNSQPKVSVLPETPYVTDEKGLQFLEFDFIVEGQKDGKYELDRIELLVLNEEGKTIKRQKLVDEGMVTNFGSFPKTEVKKDKKISLFNPFYYHAKEVDLSQLIYTLTFASKKEKFEIVKEIRPIRYNQKTKLNLPLKGLIIVDSGFDHHAHHRRLNTTHWGMRLLKISKNITRYAIDFAPCDDSGEIFNDTGKKLNDYFGFGKPVTAPAGGRVVEVVDSLPDNEIDGKLAYGIFKFIKNPKLASGNYVVIDHLNGEVSLLAHLRSGSVLVKEGQLIETGDRVGQIGNSGDSTYPHLHFQLENEHSLNIQTFPALFSELSTLNGNSVDSPVYCNTGDILTK